MLETLLKLEEDMFHERMQREIMMPLSIASQKLDGKFIEIVCPLSFKLRRDTIYKALNICILQCAIGCKRHTRAKDIKQEYVKVHVRDKNQACDMKRLQIFLFVDNDIGGWPWNVHGAIKRR